MTPHRCCPARHTSLAASSGRRDRTSVSWFKARKPTTSRSPIIIVRECPVGVEPTSPDWKPGTFAARPRAQQGGRRGSRTLKAHRSTAFAHGCHRQLACPSVLSKGCGGRNRTCVGAVNSRLPVPAQVPPQSNQSGRRDLNPRSRAPATTGTMLRMVPRRCPAEYEAFLRPASKRPAGVEPALPPRQGGRLPLHHGRDLTWAGLSKIEEHREGLEPSSPHYGCGILATGRPVRVAPPQVLCSNQGNAAKGGSMWFQASLMFIASAFVVLVGMEVVRSVVDRYRVRRYGAGGTQDIAMWGTFLGWFCLLAGAICGIVSWLTK